jgi:hypothetical protein
MDGGTRIWKEGITAGLLGAAAVAVWFLLVDIVAGAALSTPDLLGRSLLSLLGDEVALSPMWNVLIYTVFHVAVFVVVGCVVSWIVAASAATPGALVGLLMLFVVFESGFYALTLFFSSDGGVRQLAWYNIGIANLLASVLMGRYLWRSHPELADRVEGALSARL